MQDIEHNFSILYCGGKTVKETSFQIGIPEWKGYELKRKLNLHVERWQRVGMSSTFSIRTKQILFGTLLGDASLCNAGNCKYKKLEINHSPKQIEYLEWLKNELSELKPSKISDTKDRWGTLGFYTPPHPQFDEIYKICYPNKKQITKEWLAELSPLSIAVWFMDDGGSQDCCNIATCNFSLESCEMIKGFMAEKWDIKPIIRNTDYPRLSFNKTNSVKLKELIQDYIIPSMQYKLKFRKYDPEERRRKYLKRMEKVNACL